MKKSFFKIIFALVFSFFFLQSCFSGTDEEIVKTFKKKENLKISVASADCFLKKSNTDEIKVKIIFTYDKEDYTPEFKESADELLIKEVFNRKSMRGKAEWIIEIPENVNISCNTASGNIEASDHTGKCKFNTASGNVTASKIMNTLSISTASGEVKLENAKNKIEIKTASGDVSVKDADADTKISTASGDIKLGTVKGKTSFHTASGDIKIDKIEGGTHSTTASGDIRISDASLSGESSFKTVSGEIRLKLSKSLSDDLSLGTVSGNVLLEFNGNSTNGSFECTVNKHSGEIKVPEDFEQVSSNSDDNKLEKVYKSGTGKPKVTLGTLSGTISIK
jgi:DUF4097 and DUF4098 domain-containing protein YvlB